MVRWVLDECERIGRDPATFRFIHYSVLLPGASRDEALSRYRDALWAMQWKYSDMEASATRPLPSPSAPPFDKPGRRTWCRAGPHSPARRTSSSRRCSTSGRRRACQVEFVTRSHFPLLEHAAQLELMQQLAEGVAPHV